MRAITLIWATVLVAVLTAGCSGERIVNTDEPRPAPPVGTSTAPPPPPPSNAHLANAFDYVGYPPGGTGYFFTWPAAMGITGEPDSVPDAAGEDTTPNALVVERDADARFVALEQPEFTLDSDSATTLPFNRILAAAGFRCNVQEESGVSCLSERSGKGFTFSPDGFVPQYTDVPADAR